MSWIAIAILLLFSKPIITQMDKGWKSLKKSELGNDIKSFLGEEPKDNSSNSNQGNT